MGTSNYMHHWAFDGNNWCPSKEKSINSKHIFNRRFTKRIDAYSNNHWTKTSRDNHLLHIISKFSKRQLWLKWKNFDISNVKILLDALFPFLFSQNTKEKKNFRNGPRSFDDLYSSLTVLVTLLFATFSNSTFYHAKFPTAVNHH